MDSIPSVKGNSSQISSISLSFVATWSRILSLPLPVSSKVNWEFCFYKDLHSESIRRNNFYHRILPKLFSSLLGLALFCFLSWLRRELTLLILRFPQRSRTFMMPAVLREALIKGKSVATTLQNHSNRAIKSFTGPCQISANGCGGLQARNTSL